MAMFDFIGDFEGLRCQRKLVRSSPFHALAKIICHSFSFASCIADFALLLGIILLADNPAYSMAKTVKNATSLGKYSCQVVVSVFVLFQFLRQSYGLYLCVSQTHTPTSNPTTNPIRFGPDQAEGVKGGTAIACKNRKGQCRLKCKCQCQCQCQCQDERERGVKGCLRLLKGSKAMKKEAHELLIACTRVVTLLSGFGFFWTDSPLLVCMLEISRSLVGINKSLVYAD